MCRYLCIVGERNHGHPKWCLYLSCRGYLHDVKYLPHDYLHLSEQAITSFEKNRNYYKPIVDNIIVYIPIINNCTVRLHTFVENINIDTEIITIISCLNLLERKP